MNKSVYNFDLDYFKEYVECDFSSVLKKIYISSNNNRLKAYGRYQLLKFYRFIRGRIDLKYALRSIAFSDTLSMSDLPVDFHKNFLAGSHLYGMTLSVDEIGSDCLIYQNTTFGANMKGRLYNEKSDGFKPRLGHFVVAYPGAVVSGPISIGHCVIIAANAIVTKNVPNHSFVVGTNKIITLRPEQYNIFLAILNHMLIVGRRPPVGIVYSKGRYFENILLSKLKRNFLAQVSNKNSIDEDGLIKQIKSFVSDLG